MSSRNPRALTSRVAAALALAALPLACAQSRPASPPPPAYLTPLAWEANRPGAGPVYLLGSIHVGAKRRAPLHPAILEAWQRADELVVEVDLDAEAAGFRDVWSSRAYLPAGQRLEDVLSEDTWTRLQARLREAKVDPESVATLKPWAVLLRLARLQFGAEGFTPEEGVDRSFIDAAAGKPIVALESYELQLALYDSFSYELQEMMLRDLLAPEDPYYTAALVDAWARGDEQAFLDLLFPEAERWAVYRERFFFERNENMARRLEELARDGKTLFVVVGVGHMVGPRGIPALLARSGFAVERIGTP